jgi:TonB family protein
MIGSMIALAVAALANQASPVTAFALTHAQWSKMCPRVLSEVQVRLRGLSFTPIVQTAPKYPTRGEDREAMVDLDVRVATSGKVVDARVAAVNPANEDRFVEPSLTAIKSWRYAPPTLEGKPTCLAISVTIDYRLTP